MNFDTAECEDLALLLQAEIDGELDAAQAATVVRHRERCARCAASYQQLLDLRMQLRELPRAQPSSEFSAALRARLSAAAAPPVVLEPRRKYFLNPSLSFGIGAALAAALAFVVVLPATDNMADAVVTEHVRSLQAEHLLDVISTDQHTVKPWFNGRLDFAPPVVDLVEKGFPLTGGRLDYLAGRTVAALVYHHNKHPINLFVWPNSDGRSASSPHCQQRTGYHLCNWSSQSMHYWAVSDLNETELNQFASYWRD